MKDSTNIRLKKCLNFFSMGTPNFFKHFSAFLIIILLISIQCGYSNNVKVTNVRVVIQDPFENTAYAMFDLSWDNSWRLMSMQPRNYDAVWIIIKVRVGNSEWKHVKINSNTLSPSTAAIEIPPDKMGVFIYPEAEGSGNNQFKNIGLQFNYDSLNINDTSHIDIRVFAIEMVYVKEGTFVVGSEGDEANAFTITTINTGDASILPTGTGGVRGSAQGGFPTGEIAPNSEWPNGYKAFYCMKYEITQGQYADFLNCLTDTQRTKRYYPPGST